MILECTFYLLKKEKQDKTNKKQKKKATTTTAFMPSHKLRQSADNYRRKIFDQIDSDSEQREKKETNSQSQEKQAEQVVERRKLKLEEAYEILRKKKDNEIAKITIQQEEEEMKHCTFHPNIGKKKNTEIDIKETVQKLYIDGVTKQKTRLNEEKKRRSFK